jgi:hypothetical protein
MDPRATDHRTMDWRATDLRATDLRVTHGHCTDKPSNIFDTLKDVGLCVFLKLWLFDQTDLTKKRF